MIPASLQANPSLDRWVAFPAPGVARIAFGKVEYGQGALTALAQIAAEELDVSMAQVQVANAATGAVPDEGMTVGSMSIEVSGSAVRAACAEVRALFVAQAARRLDCAEGQIDVRDGAFLREGQATGETYWTLAPAIDLAQPPAARPAGSPRISTAWWAAANRAWTCPPRCSAEDSSRTSSCPACCTPGCCASRDPPPAWRNWMSPPPAGPPRPPTSTSWWRGPSWPSSPQRSRRRPRPRRRRTDHPVGHAPRSLADPQRSGVPKGDADDGTGDRRPGRRPRQPQASAGGLFPALYRPRLHVALLRHRPFRGRQADRLDPRPGGLSAPDADRPHHRSRPEAIDLEHAQGAGCYGHNGAEDAAYDAAFIASRRPGRRSASSGGARTSSAIPRSAPPCASRWPPSWTPRAAWWTGPPRSGPICTSTAAAPDRAGPASGSPDLPAPNQATAFGGRLNAVPSYDIEAVRVKEHLVVHSPVRTSSLRGLGGPVNTYAGECFLDEIAQAAGQDPLAFRLAMLSDPRARAVVERIGVVSGWNARGAGGEGQGLGLAYDRHRDRGAYVAVAAKVSVDEEVRLEHLWCVADAGLIINPDGAKNQIEGGMIMAASWALKEQVKLEGRGVASVTWDDYPILRFDEVPPVDIELIVPRAPPPTASARSRSAPVSPPSATPWPTPWAPACATCPIRGTGSRGPCWRSRTAEGRPRRGGGRPADHGNVRGRWCASLSTRSADLRTLRLQKLEQFACGRADEAGF
uniref:Xanthine dehydrogenase family protein molybdopterin-binding subunit n=1 Tax=Phenylobacterium glaciei TaxID=2803784 RepID=A0A974SB91_9CAUL|nr:xanthine dehydrogenase family protein molybdopterin-binding subunit [Phenylobacterium glaciei]